MRLSVEGQREFLEAEGFRQIGAGSGGYAVYVCQRQVGSRHKTGMDGFEDENVTFTILLHVTPYGPSILNVMPRYIVVSSVPSLIVVSSLLFPHSLLHEKTSQPITQICKLGFVVASCVALVLLFLLLTL